jgi:hypothetical protein
MRRSSAREAQVEPLAALAAEGVVALALAAYAGAFEASLPGASERNVVKDTADRVERGVTVGGVARPSRLSPKTLQRVGPDGYHVNATLATDGRTYRAGPAAPASAEAAKRRVSVRTDTVVPGRLEVRVWLR